LPCNWCLCVTTSKVFAKRIQRQQQQNHPAQIPLLSSIDEHNNWLRKHLICNLCILINIASHGFVWLDRAKRPGSCDKMEWLVHAAAEHSRPT
jgi:hypothetical protein